MKTITNFFVIGCLGSLVAIGYHIATDIHAIRETLEPHPFSVGLDAKPIPNHAEWRGEDKQEVTAL